MGNLHFEFQQKKKNSMFSDVLTSLEAHSAFYTRDIRGKGTSP